MIHPRIVDGIANFPGIPSDGGWKVGQTLKIGKIINHKGEVVTSLVLEPQGIAHLVSDDRVRLPIDVCGLAHVLTGMCNEGLLTLNIGVVDPGWDNHLSTPVLNFSSEKRLLQVGAPFIRITYHQIIRAEGAKPGKPFPNISSEDYERRIRSRAVGDFGKSFLNIKQLVGKASEKENARFKESMLKYLPIGAFSLAVFALLVTVGVATVARLANDSRQVEFLERLSERVDQLESERRPVSPPETAVVQTKAEPKRAIKEGEQK